jgi:hypothetical protein
MKVKRRKPDILIVLAILVGLGVVLTMKAQTVLDAITPDAVAVEKSALYQQAWVETQQNYKRVSSN